MNKKLILIPLIFILSIYFVSAVDPIYDLGGMFGEGRTNPDTGTPTRFFNPVTGSLTCPAGYTASQIYEYFLTPYSDWPLTFCHKPYTGAGYLDFGGMYSEYMYNSEGFVNEYPNPVTGSLTCPAGYTATQLLGVNGWDNKLVLCHRPITVNEGELFFGGMYSDSYNNPATGDRTCPTGYTVSQVMSTLRMDRHLYFCYYVNPNPTPPCTPTETPETSCTDGTDNDCDGKIDSLDSDCVELDLDNGLIAKWTFNTPRTTTVFAFDMIGEHHGTSYNIIHSTNSFEIAEFARSYDFNGVDSYVEVPDSTEISGGNKDMTVSVWFKLRDIPTGGALHIISKTLGATHKDYYMDIVNSKLAFGYENGNDWDNSGSGIPGTTTLSINTWYNGVFTYDLSSKALKLYLNGNLENSWTLPADLPDTTASLLFGKSGGFYNRPVDVIIDEVSIYSRTLSDEEVAGLYSLKPSIEEEPTLPCTPTETPEATCDDGIDNDCDTLVDSADSDCQALPDCTTTNCAEQIDMATCEIGECCIWDPVDGCTINEGSGALYCLPNDALHILEECDPLTPIFRAGEDTCEAFGYVGGTLACTAECKLDTSQCTLGTECEGITDCSHYTPEQCELDECAVSSGYGCYTTTDCSVCDVSFCEGYTTQTNCESNPCFNSIGLDCKWDIDSCIEDNTVVINDQEWDCSGVEWGECFEGTRTTTGSCSSEGVDPQPLTVSCRVTKEFPFFSANGIIIVLALLIGYYLFVNYNKKFKK